MEVIERGSCEIALAVDDDGRLLGTLTDGDVRRALLGGRALEDPVKADLSTDPITVLRTDSRPEVLDLMRAHRVSQIPVLDDGGRVVGIHLLDALLGVGELPNVAVLIAGGRGSRLASLTEHVPKPMLTVAGRPILERLVLHLVGSGIRHVVISVNYLAEVIEGHFGDGSAFGCRIDYLREDPDEPLGTAGSLALLASTVGVPDEPLLVLNGDLVTQFAVGEMLRHHEESGAEATMAVREYTHQIPFGVVHPTVDGGLDALVEKPVESWLISAGIYVLDPGLVADIPPDQESSVPELLSGVRARSGSVGLWRLHDEWIDVGRPSELRRARGQE
jgi:dTDP-glucose pyrophosphorylase